MLDFASSVTCNRSTSLRRDCTWLERVPAAKRAMNSFNWAIFFSRCAFCPSICERTCVFAITMSSYVSNDGLVIDVGDVSTNAVEKMAVVRNHDQHALILIKKILQPVDRVQIQVVRGLVEQQRLRMPKQRLRQQHAHLLPARNLRH